MKNFPDMPESVFPEMPKICIDQKGVENLLLNLNPNKAAGPDAIPAKILRECASSLAPVLTKIFQKSLDSGCLPEAWLDANVTPLYKKGDRCIPADDCILYSKINTTEDSKRLQKDLDSLLSWEKDWQMSFNASKCFTLRVTHKKVPITNNYMMGDTVLEEVKHHPYLGVELSNDLKWSTHISQITTKANKMLGLLKRNIYYCSKSTRSIAYKSLVRPKLEYCSAICDPKHKLDRDKLEEIQNRAARFTVRDYSRDSSITKILADLEWESLHVRRTRSRLITIYKETHGLIPSNIKSFLQSPRSEMHPHTRQTGYLKYNFITTNKDCYRYSLYPRTIPEWNLLDLDTCIAPDVNSFKEKLG
ncbi:hypothetical protein HOLleu_08350 [Holothuria leucospilota]|uniref:RNA-directed DNA polymerase from mobile element jockey n=1 Tax=Holothuria leucospilota TaxID=206669 RepID=A0A9Q1CIS7_HOLLE|nr:hypothetical protein HOLleu_08350 [Holothuria leucospilota]